MDLGLLILCIRWLLTATFGAMGLYCTIANWTLQWLGALCWFGIIRQRRLGSMIPFVGGLFMCIAFCLAPIGVLSERIRWAWLPLMADPSVAILPTFPFVMLWQAREEQRAARRGKDDAKSGSTPD